MTSGELDVLRSRLITGEFNRALSQDELAEFYLLLQQFPLDEQLIWGRCAGILDTQFFSRRNLLVAAQATFLDIVASTMKTTIALWPEIPSRGAEELITPEMRQRGSIYEVNEKSKVFGTWGLPENQNELKDRMKYGAIGRTGIDAGLIVSTTANPDRLCTSIPSAWYSNKGSAPPQELSDVLKTIVDEIGWLIVQVSIEPAILLLYVSDRLCDSYQTILRECERHKISSATIEYINGKLIWRERLDPEWGKRG